jgi:RHS repeat-associated protein
MGPPFTSTGPGDQPIEQVNGERRALYLHHDQQGSTRLLTVRSRAAEGNYSFSAYGVTSGHGGTASTPLGYDGQYTSGDTGLIYLRARVYDPATAQFLSVDPIAAITRAPYTYARDNSLNRGDASGLSSLNPFSEGFWTEGNFISEARSTRFPTTEKRSVPTKTVAAILHPWRTDSKERSLELPCSLEERVPMR